MLVDQVFMDQLRCPLCLQQGLDLLLIRIQLPGPLVGPTIGAIIRLPLNTFDDFAVDAQLF